jgi:hypothetical protein
MIELQALLSNENYASGISAKPVLSNVETQINNLMQGKNDDIMSESLKKLLYRQDNI